MCRLGYQWNETSVGTGSGLLRQQNIHVLFFGDLVGSLVDPLAAELVFLPETVKD
jgi:hypothetical protein